MKSEPRRTLAAWLLVVSFHAPADPGSDPGRGPASGPLSLERAVALSAAAGDPSLQRLDARAEALERAAVAEAQLPDPAISTQLANVPADTFAFDQSEMTQLRLGLRQEFPPGRTLALRGDRLEQQAEAERARARLQQREIDLAVREAWFELAYRLAATDIVTASRESVSRQVDSLSARFATGRINAQEVLRAELELALLEDRLAEHRRQADLARATLGRYIGPHATAPLPQGWPELDPPDNLPQLKERLTTHPAVAVEAAEVEAAEVGVALAEQAYKPAMTLEGGYGVRQDRPDFASIGITVSLPLFTNKRQDQQVASAERRRGAESFDRAVVLLDLKRSLEQAWADWQHYSARVDLYQRVVRERATRTASASITTYASGQTDFAELIRSQLAELEAALKQAELRARAGQAWSRLVYLTGEH